MSKYDDFDLDLKVVNDGYEDNSDRKTFISCKWCPTKGCTKTCFSPLCPVPTKDYPAQSCFKKNENGIQVRC